MARVMLWQLYWSLASVLAQTFPKGKIGSREGAKDDATGSRCHVGECVLWVAPPHHRNTIVQTRYYVDVQPGFIWGGTAVRRITAVDGVAHPQHREVHHKRPACHRHVDAHQRERSLRRHCVGIVIGVEQKRS
jgi:hypothetical protein